MRGNLLAIAVCVLLAPGCGPGRQADSSPERRIALEGQSNFRDLGGYETTDGRTVKWGQLYRSGDLSKLTAEDVGRLHALGIRLVCDFRTNAEVEQRGKDQLSEGAGGYAIPISAGGEAKKLRALALESSDFSGVGPELMLETYRSLALDFAPAWKSMFARLSDAGNRPAIIHCSGGKDRAGVEAALVLRSLGVPMEAVVEDFLLTNEYRGDSIRKTLAGIQQDASEKRGVSAEEIDMSGMESLYLLRPEYLQAAFHAIDEEFGSFDAYLRDALGFDEAALKSWRDSMLEE